jgi:hypothetical protein
MKMENQYRGNMDNIFVILFQGFLLLKNAMFRLKCVILLQRMPMRVIWSNGQQKPTLYIMLIL